MYISGHKTGVSKLKQQNLLFATVKYSLSYVRKLTPSLVRVTPETSTHSSSAEPAANEENDSLNIQMIFWRYPVTKEDPLLQGYIFGKVSPKACGHTQGRKVVSREEAVMRIKAAVDARKESGSDIVIVARRGGKMPILSPKYWILSTFLAWGAYPSNAVYTKTCLGVLIILVTDDDSL
ncbi:hypothetical protein F8388_004258 [Cannabis sativa]|uniref:Uncharacterized protein n=1 Tax=Cannabis sativa TaxID=3483 RepID=A0A7J6F7C6_CANSA|nr:hypothetical protein F8388_004258 [Cannabis sativa]